MTPPRARRSIPFAACVALACLGFAPLAAPARAATTVVYVFDFDFSANLPDEPILDPTISLGDTIRWVWLGDMHNTVACLGQTEDWRCDLFDTGDTFEHTFTHAGVFWYYCEPHGLDNGDGTASGMSGTITVTPAPGSLMLGAIAAAGAVRARRTRR